MVKTHSYFLPLLAFTAGSFYSFYCNFRDVLCNIKVLSITLISYILTEFAHHRAHQKKKTLFKTIISAQTGLQTNFKGHDHKH